MRPALPAPTPPRLELGAEDDAAPWSYADGTGYVNDVVRQAFAQQGWEVRFRIMPYVRCKQLALDGQLAGCFTTGHIAQLGGALLFPAQPVISPHNLLLARAGSAFSGCDPIAWPRSPRIGVVRGYEYSARLDGLLARTGVREEADSEVSNLRKLQAGRLDLALMMVDEVKRIELLVRLADLPQSSDFAQVCDLGELPSYVVFSPAHALGHEALLAFEGGYASLSRSGALARLQRSWRVRALDLAASKAH